MGGRRIVVTGLGVISAIGRTVPEFWDSLVAGRSGIGPMETVDRSQFRFQNGAEVRGYAPPDYFEEKEITLLDRFAQFALIACSEAVRDAGVEWSRETSARTAIVTGSCLGGQVSQDQAFYDVYWEKRGRIQPLSIPRVMANAATSHISMKYGITGPAFTVSTACSSANHAIGQAFWMVRDGTADMAIAGGSDAPFAFAMLKAWEAMRVVAPDTCRPFAKDRKGMILGEGAGILILEPLEAAQARGARIYAEIAGFGMTADAHHITQPSVDGPAAAMRAALADAALDLTQVGYINAHGTGTPVNDPAEVTAIRKAFGDHAERLAVSSTKSMHGHALGAAGALEAVATVLALHHGIAPPTANFTEPDPECDLYVVPNQARRLDVEAALSNSFAFGGLNAVLAFRRWGE
ncbi:MAG TPA: beta-ketoacyl-[acyl-carrier-protein] synthase family protein [Bryobacteraceae bacterium]|nr:beta-ketoacyl-[acyl-carrier-protein] synthase family protein [Bryobacteraceae bacterium]